MCFRAWRTITTATTATDGQRRETGLRRRCRFYVWGKRTARRVASARVEDLSKSARGKKVGNTGRCGVTSLRSRAACRESSRTISHWWQLELCRVLPPSPFSREGGKGRGRACSQPSLRDLDQGKKRGSARVTRATSNSTSARHLLATGDWRPRLFPRWPLQPQGWRGHPLLPLVGHNDRLWVHVRTNCPPVLTSGAAALQEVKVSKRV